MGNHSIYEDIAERTQGDIYIGAEVILALIINKGRGEAESLLPLPCYLGLEERREVMVY